MHRYQVEQQPLLEIFSLKDDMVLLIRYVPEACAGLIINWHLMVCQS